MYDRQLKHNMYFTQMYLVSLNAIRLELFLFWFASVSVELLLCELG